MAFNLSFQPGPPAQIQAPGATLIPTFLQTPSLGSPVLSLASFCGSDMPYCWPSSSPPRLHDSLCLFPSVLVLHPPTEQFQGEGRPPPPPGVLSHVHLCGRPRSQLLRGTGRVCPAGRKQTLWVPCLLQFSDLNTRINPHLLFSVSPEGKEKKAQKQ